MSDTITTNGRVFDMSKPDDREACFSAKWAEAEEKLSKSKNALLLIATAAGKFHRDGTWCAEQARTALEDLK